MSCQCRDATLRAYQELKDAGQREEHAYDAAVQVFRYFHPNRPRIDCYQVVADWLDNKEIGCEPGGIPWEAETEPS